MKFLLIGLFILMSVPALAIVQSRCNLTTQGQFSATGTTQQMLAASSTRTGLWLSIPSGGSIAYVKFGNLGHTGTEGITLASQSTFQFLPVPGGSVWIKSIAGVVPVNFQECQE